MATGDIYAVITTRDGDGTPLRMNLMVSSGANSSWPDKKRGTAFWVENDNLCDVYAVVFDGHERGVVEDYGHSIGAYPDLDTPLDTRLFATVVRGLTS